jgi:hypothetical protein
MRLGSTRLCSFALLAACAALLDSGAAQAATVVAGASASVIGDVLADPAVIIAVQSSASNVVTITAVNVTPHTDAASLSGVVTLADGASAPLQAGGGDKRTSTAAKAADAAADGPPSANTTASAPAASNAGSGVLSANQRLAVDISQADLASIGSVSVTLNYN